MLRWLLALVGVFIAVFGFFCLNYTKGDTIEHHRQVAHERGWPAPGREVFYLGVFCVATGAAAAGYVIGSRPRIRSSRDEQ